MAWEIRSFQMLKRFALAMRRMVSAITHKSGQSWRRSTTASAMAKDERGVWVKQSSPPKPRDMMQSHKPLSPGRVRLLGRGWCLLKAKHSSVGGGAHERWGE